jgi:hypothetical protein
MKQHKYERIDKGVKRTPRAPKNKRDEQTGQFLPVVNLDEQTVFDRIRAGEHASQIAAELGLHKSAISHRYRQNPEYLEARLSGAENRLEQAEIEIRAADDPLTLARAREVFRAVAWRCEREFPARWGQSHHLTVENVGDLGEKLRRSRERVIEGETVAQIPNAALLPPATPETDISEGS